VNPSSNYIEIDTNMAHPAMVIPQSTNDADVESGERRGGRRCDLRAGNESGGARG
jgi:hypothetical protein